jgi:ABC-2 type transport system permease protein
LREVATTPAARSRPPTACPHRRRSGTELARADHCQTKNPGPPPFTGYLLVAIAGTTCLALTAGLSAGAARTIQTRHIDDLLGVVAGSLLQLPAIWVVVGVVVAAFGVDARFAVTGWIALTTFFILGEVGAMFALPRGVIDLSPFAHVPQLPGAAVHATPIIVLLGIASVLTAAGLAAFRHRDIG